MAKSATKEGRFFYVLYGILALPPTVIIGGIVWGFVFLAAQSNPDSILAWGAAFVVWLVFVLEGFNYLLFNRRALPWLPLWLLLPRGIYEPPPLFAFVGLFFTYALLGLVAYKIASEPG
jgi:hypothetical protein